MQIDAHFHLWQYSTREFGWISDEMAELRSDFLPAHLEQAFDSAGVGAGVVVQARQSLEETEWLLQLAAETERIAGVVGWFDLNAVNVAEQLDRYADARKLVGVRHIVQAEQPGFLDLPAFNQGIATLAQHGLVYDILIFPSQLEETIRFVDRHPSQRFVVDHCAKPYISAGEIVGWKQQMAELAKRENVACKISGLVTEADWKKWTPEGLRPYMDCILAAFGAGRCMAGSDWPVLLTASTYEQWWNILSNYAGELTVQERNTFMGGAACNWYGLHRTLTAATQPTLDNGVEK